VRVQVLDGIFDRHDVLAAFAVDLVDDRRERRALARTRRTGNEHQPARAIRELGDALGQAQLVEAQDLERDGAERTRYRAPLQEDVGAKARKALYPEGQIELLALFEGDLLILREHRVAQLLGLHRRQRGQLERHDVAVDAQQWGRTRGDVHVAGALLD